MLDKLDFCLLFGHSKSLKPFYLDPLLVSSFNAFSFSADATCLPQISWNKPVKREPMGWGFGVRWEGKGGGREEEKVGKRRVESAYWITLLICVLF